MRQSDLRDLLEGGDRRSTGRAEEVAALLARDPVLLGAAIHFMLDADPLIRMRSADAVEKATRADPSLLQPHKATLLGPIAVVEQQEVKWHLLQMLSRLVLTDAERQAAVAIAERALQSSSRIVQAEALSALFGVSAHDPALMDRARGAASEAATSDSPAVRARALKLLQRR